MPRVLHFSAASLGTGKRGSVKRWRFSEFEVAVCGPIVTVLNSEKILRLVFPFFKAEIGNTFRLQLVALFLKAETGNSLWLQPVPLFLKADTDSSLHLVTVGQRLNNAFKVCRFSGKLIGPTVH